MDLSRAMSDEMARALLGRHFEPQGSDSLEVQELRLRVRESAAAVQNRLQELEVARLVLQRVKGEFEQAIARQELGRSLPEVPHTDLIMIDTQGTLGMAPPTLGMLSPRPASVASTRVLVPAPLAPCPALESLGISTVDSVILVPETIAGYLPTASSVGMPKQLSGTMSTRELPRGPPGTAHANIPIKAPPHGTIIGTAATDDYGSGYS